MSTRRQRAGRPFMLAMHIRAFLRPQTIQARRCLDRAAFPHARTYSTAATTLTCVSGHGIRRCPVCANFAQSANKHACGPCYIASRSSTSLKDLVPSGTVHAWRSMRCDAAAIVRIESRRPSQARLCTSASMSEAPVPSRLQC